MENKYWITKSQIDILARALTWPERKAIADGIVHRQVLKGDEPSDSKSKNKQNEND